MKKITIRITAASPQCPCDIAECLYSIIKYLESDEIKDNLIISKGILRTDIRVYDENSDNKAQD